MKLAKFALTCDGEKITSLEQLKDHFNLLDVLEHYKTNTLWRWLRSRGYQNELTGIEAITATQDTEILSALCQVFGIEADRQMIQEVLEEQKSMEAQEKLQTEPRAQKQDPLSHALTRTEHSIPANPNFKDYLKSYTALKNQLFNAKDLEEGKAVLRELVQDYAELLEMDKLNVACVLYPKTCTHQPTFFSLLWLSFLVHGWGLEWDNFFPFVKKDYGFDVGNSIHYLSDINFNKLVRFSQVQTLKIPEKGKVHVFEKAVCVAKQYKYKWDFAERDERKEYQVFKPYDLEHHCIENDPKNFVEPAHFSDFYLCRGAVKVEPNPEYCAEENTLSYIEIEP
ncbi:hypothetical protein [Helicobacter salomonis]|uniref:hypothetical protein n=1 Tax=Helicobacter salomonis TaxID=56878 RepID=UPI000CF024B9|nr:hypothetical protein [Helicobacter salomonis]